MPWAALSCCDRPDELLSGVGFDFPINKHFQLIAEARSTMYVAGKTPNAFNNNPVEVLGSVRIFPARWWGVWRGLSPAHESADAGHFNEPEYLGSKPEWRLCPRPSIVVCAGTAVQTAAGAPRAMRPEWVHLPVLGRTSESAHRVHTLTSDQAVPVSSSSASITLPCPPGTVQ